VRARIALTTAHPRRISEDPALSLAATPPSNYSATSSLRCLEMTLSTVDIVVAWPVIA
jgi:hypothetical protein